MVPIPLHADRRESTWMDWVWAFGGQRLTAPRSARSSSGGSRDCRTWTSLRTCSVRSSPTRGNCRELHGLAFAMAGPGFATRSCSISCAYSGLAIRHGARLMARRGASRSSVRRARSRLPARYRLGRMAFLRLASLAMVLAGCGGLVDDGDAPHPEPQAEDSPQHKPEAERQHEAEHQPGCDVGTRRCSDKLRQACLPGGWATIEACPSADGCDPEHCLPEPSR